ncbi:hypothetical protein Scep_014272 [Stephania cephalantha]|uniref:Uncharacterized protein n=1 Tax=Stephania cephalantha TaxID=152367 RepID=A0AAP0P2U9_9MAGN
MMTNGGAAAGAATGHRKDRRKGDRERAAAAAARAALNSGVDGWTRQAAPASAPAISDDAGEEEAAAATVNGVGQRARWRVAGPIDPEETQQQWTRRRDFDAARQRDGLLAKKTRGVGHAYLLEVWTAKSLRRYVSTIGQRAATSEPGAGSCYCRARSDCYLGDGGEWLNWRGRRASVAPAGKLTANISGDRRWRDRAGMMTNGGAAEVRRRAIEGIDAREIANEQHRWQRGGLNSGARWVDAVRLQQWHQRELVTPPRRSGGGSGSGAAAAAAARQRRGERHGATARWRYTGPIDPRRYTTTMDKAS